MRAEVQGPNSDLGNPKKQHLNSILIYQESAQGEAKVKGVRMPSVVSEMENQDWFKT